jgi:hypothetical protein
VVAVGLLWQSILFASGLLGGTVLLLFPYIQSAARARRAAAAPGSGRPGVSPDQVI